MSKYNKFPAFPGMKPAVMSPKSIARANAVKSAIGKVNVDYPGQNMDLSLDQVKNLVNNAPKAVGERFVSSGSTLTVVPKFPPQAKYLIGFSFSQITNTDDQFNLTINNEQSIINGSATAFQKPQQSGSDKPYFEWFRPIGGSAQVELNYNSPAGGGDNIVVTFFYV